MAVCPHCKGKGIILIPHKILFVRWDSIIECGVCDGTGQISDFLNSFFTLGHAMSRCCTALYGTPEFKNAEPDPWQSAIEDLDMEDL